MPYSLLAVHDNVGFVTVGIPRESVVAPLTHMHRLCTPLHRAPPSLNVSSVISITDVSPPLMHCEVVDIANVGMCCL